MNIVSGYALDFFEKIVEGTPIEEAISDYAASEQLILTVDMEVLKIQISKKFEQNFIID